MVVGRTLSVRSQTAEYLPRSSCQCQHCLCHVRERNEPGLGVTTSKIFSFSSDHPSQPTPSAGGGATSHKNVTPFIKITGLGNTNPSVSVNPSAGEIEPICGIGRAASAWMMLTKLTELERRSLACILRAIPKRDDLTHQKRVLLKVRTRMGGREDGERSEGRHIVLAWDNSRPVLVLFSSALFRCRSSDRGGGAKGAQQKYFWLTTAFDACLLTINTSTAFNRRGIHYCRLLLDRFSSSAP